MTNHHLNPWWLIINWTITIKLPWNFHNQIKTFPLKEMYVKMSFVKCRPFYLGLNALMAVHDDVIKWKHFPRYWPFVRGNSPVTGEFPKQRPVSRSFDVFFDLRLNKRLRKQSWGWWFETLSRPLRCHCNGLIIPIYIAWLLNQPDRIQSRGPANQAAGLSRITLVWWLYDTGIALKNSPFINTFKTLHT